MQYHNTPLKNNKAEQFVRREVLGAFEEVLKAAADKAISSITVCRGKRDNFEQVKSLFINRYLEPLIQYMSMEE